MNFVISQGGPSKTFKGSNHFFRTSKMTLDHNVYSISLFQTVAVCQSVLSSYHHHYDLHEEASIWWAGFCHCIILDWCNLNSPFKGHIMVMREWRLRVSCFYPPTIAHLIDMGTSIHRGSRVVVVRSSRLLASMDLSTILYHGPASIPINRNLLWLCHPPSN